MPGKTDFQARLSRIEARRPAAALAHQPELAPPRGAEALMDHALGADRPGNRMPRSGPRRPVLLVLSILGLTLGLGSISLSLNTLSSALAPKAGLSALIGAQRPHNTSQGTAAAPVARRPAPTTQPQPRGHASQGPSSDPIAGAELLQALGNPEGLRDYIDSHSALGMGGLAQRDPATGQAQSPQDALERLQHNPVAQSLRSALRP